MSNHGGSGPLPHTLAPGVVVTRVESKTGLAHGGWNTAVIELQVDPREIDVFTKILKGLRDLCSPQQTYSMTSSSVSAPLYAPPEDEPGAEWTVEELEENGGVPPEEVTMESLKQLIEERFDAVEQAVRLALGE